MINLRKEIESKLKKANLISDKIKLDHIPEIPPLITDGFKVDCIVEFFSEVKPKDKNLDDYDKTINALREIIMPGKNFRILLDSLLPLVKEEKYFKSRFTFVFHFLDAPELPEIEEIKDTPPMENKGNQDVLKGAVKEAIIEMAVEGQEFMEKEDKKEEKKDKSKAKKGGK